MNDQAIPKVWKGISSKSGLNAALVGCIFALVGCEGQPPQFSSNSVVIQRLAIEGGETVPQQGMQAVHFALEELFGTPNVPVLPAGYTSEEVRLERLEQAAGPVYSDEQDTHFGLYRKHCVRCHGITGDGRGPAARLLSPYPRDFRVGKFKFKSTPIGTKPTREDLTKVLREGVPGTSMPSFRLLRDEEIDALVDYVIYLTARGETERELLRRAVFEVDWEEAEHSQAGGEPMGGSLAATGDALSLQVSKLETARIALENLQKWQVIAPSMPDPPGNFPLLWGSQGLSEAESLQLKLSVDRGRELFRSSVASCSKCHGENAEGGSFVKDYDDWTKEWTLAIGIDPEDRQKIRPFVKAGALKPVTISARNLQWAAFRGGNRPEDLFRRIVHGIEGTPMPSASLNDEMERGLTRDQVWDLVNYLYSFSNPALTVGDPSPAESHSEGGEG